jgi:tripartite-type tricarboxylate transporter receptor subunit TctC
LNKALADPAVLKKFADFGFEPLRVTPDEFHKMAREEARRWGPVIQAAHITLD